MSSECAVDLGPVEAVLDGAAEARRGNGKAIRSEDLIPILQEVQQAYGYLPVSAVERVSQRTGIPMSQIYGVVTFYAQFYLEPHGKHTVTLCRGTSCHVRGGNRALGVVKGLLGIEDGETTPDFQFSLETVACLGACAVSPVMVVDGKYYGKLTPRAAERIIRRIMQEGQ